MIKRVVALLILSNILCLTVHAYNNRKEIRAFLCSDMPVYFNGDKIEFTDPDTGDTLSPILYAGRAYIPIRCLQNYTDVYANFDDKTDSLYLNDVTSNKYSTISTGIDYFFILSNIDSVVPKNETAAKYLNNDESIIQDWSTYVESINAIDYSIIIPPMLFEVNTDAVIKNLEANNFTLAEKGESMYYKNGTVEVKLTPTNDLLQISLVTGYKSTYAIRDLKFI